MLILFIGSSTGVNRWGTGGRGDGGTGGRGDGGTGGRGGRGDGDGGRVPPLSSVGGQHSNCPSPTFQFRKIAGHVA